jgi:phage terminase large subunit-like protein
LLTIAEKRELLELHEERRRRLKRRRLFSYTPYPKQLEFHTAGKTERERLLMAGNQLGKTWCMGFELAMHLTGRYPGPGEVFYPTQKQLLALARQDAQLAEGLFENLDELGLLGADVYPEGWPGYRFNKPIWVWASSVSGEATRDNPQRILIGPPSDKSEWGTGAIPHQDLLNADGEMQYKMAQGTPDGLDRILVNHLSGGSSILQFKSYSQGREKWQGPTLDFVWYDEEPPLDIYMEGLTRTNKTQGPNALTFTPLQGMSSVVQLFIGTEQDDALAEPAEVE